MNILPEPRTPNVDAAARKRRPRGNAVNGHLRKTELLDGSRGTSRRRTSVALLLALAGLSAGSSRAVPIPGRAPSPGADTARIADPSAFDGRIYGKGPPALDASRPGNAARYAYQWLSPDVVLVIDRTTLAAIPIVYVDDARRRFAPCPPAPGRGGDDVWVGVDALTYENAQGASETVPRIAHACLSRLERDYRDLHPSSGRDENLIGYPDLGLFLIEQAILIK